MSTFPLHYVWTIAFRGRGGTVLKGCVLLYSRSNLLERRQVNANIKWINLLQLFVCAFLHLEVSSVLDEISHKGIATTILDLVWDTLPFNSIEYYSKTC